MKLHAGRKRKHNINQSIIVGDDMKLKYIRNMRDISCMVLLGCMLLSALLPGRAKAAEANQEVNQEIAPETDTGEEPDTEEKETVLEVRISTLEQKEGNVLLLKWQPAEGAVSYVLYQLGEAGEKKQVSSLPAKMEEPEEEEKSEEGLLTLNWKVKVGTVYQYRLEAFNETGECIGASQVLEVGVPSKVTQVKTTKTGPGRVMLTWAASDAASSYLIYSEKENGTYKKLGESDACSYPHNSAKGSEIYYQVIPVYKSSYLSSQGIKSSVSFQGRGGSVTFKNRAVVDIGHQKYSYKEMQNDLRALEKKFSAYCQLEVIGNSRDSRDIYAMTIGSPDAEKHLVVVAAIHAREYMTSQLCVKQMEYYLDSYNQKIGTSKGKDIFEKLAITYIPMLNPDGVSITQSGFSAITDKALREQLKKMPGSRYPSLWKANAAGIDLNRNFSCGFGKGSEKQAGSSGYAGKKALSEPESTAAADKIKQLNRGKHSVIGIVNYHATGSILFGSCKKTASAKVRKQTYKMFMLAKKVTGYRSAQNVYPDSSNGDFRSYQMYTLKIPSITVEIGRSPCPLKIWEFSSIWASNKNLILEEAKLLL